MTAGSKPYAEFQDEHTLVPVKIWCRPKDLNALREYAEQLVRGRVSPDHRRDAGGPAMPDWADLSRRALLMAQGWREAEAKKSAARRAQRTGSERVRMTERFKSRPDPQPEPLQKKTARSIPRVINNDPAQLRRVIQYHHPDKGNPGSDARLFFKAKEMLAQVRRERG